MEHSPEKSIKTTALTLRETTQDLTQSTQNIVDNVLTTLPSHIETQLLKLGQETIQLRLEKINSTMIDEFAKRIANLSVETSDEYYLLHTLLDNLEKELYNYHIQPILNQKKIVQEKQKIQQKYTLCMLLFQFILLGFCSYLLYYNLLSPSDDSCEISSTYGGKWGCILYSTFQQTTNIGKNFISYILTQCIKIIIIILGTRVISNGLFELPTIGKKKSELHESFQQLFHYHRMIVKNNIQQMKTIIKLGLKHITRNQSSLIPHLMTSLPGETPKEQVHYLIHEIIDSPKHILQTMGLILSMEEKQKLEQLTISTLTKLNDTHSTEIVLMFNKGIQQSKTDIENLQTSIKNGFSKGVNIALYGSAFT